MDFEKLGGRKFILTLICVAVGTAIELKTATGVSASFAGLLAALVAAFGAANAYNTKQALEMQPDVHLKIDPVALEEIESRLDTKVEEFGHALDEVRRQATEARETAEAAGNALVNMSQLVENTKKVATAALRANGG